MYRIHVDDTPEEPTHLTPEEAEEQARYTEFLEEAAEVEVIEPDLIRRYRELTRRGAC